MNPKPYRAIVSTREGFTQRQLLDAYMDRKAVFDRIHEDITVTIDRNLVPRVVDARQIDVIRLRRQVRSVIEKERVAAGKRPDGRREGAYKYLKRHESASMRPRDTLGAFSSGKLADREQPLALLNS